MKGDTNATSGYLIFSALAVVVFALALQDPMYIVFGIPIAITFALGASKNLTSIGWTETNLSSVVPVGVIGGIASLIIGGFLINFTPQNIGSIVPDFSSMGKLATATIIPPTIAVGANILAQWLVVAPAEESITKVLAPFAGITIFGNQIIAFILATLIWLLMHVPTFVMQGTSQNMYLVLIAIMAISLITMLMTGSVLAAIIVHGIFNTGVILATSGFTMTTFYAVAIVGAVLIFVWIEGVSHAKARRG